MGRITSKVTNRVSEWAMGDSVVMAYERVAHGVTSQVALLALASAGPIVEGTRLLDIAAGAGALSIPAAKLGARVLAIDTQSEIVDRLAIRLSSFQGCRAQGMDGHSLPLDDNQFDVSFSVFGLTQFRDWRIGLTEQMRVLVPGGKGCVAIWKTPSGPIKLLMAAMARAFPNRPVPRVSPAAIELSNVGRLSNEMKTAGYIDVSSRQVEVIWESPIGDAFLDYVRPFYRFLVPYATLDSSRQSALDLALREISLERAVEGKLQVKSSAVISVGRAHL